MSNRKPLFGLDIGETQCCFCGKVFTYRPHNAEPLSSGKCCNVCNKVVIAVRNSPPKNILFNRYHPFHPTGDSNGVKWMGKPRDGRWVWEGT